MSVSALPQVRLKIERRSSHPWIFQKMVEKPDKRLPPGTVVDIIDRDGNWAGRGFWNGHSRISLRVLTNDPALGVLRHADAGYSEAIDQAHHFGLALPMPAPAAGSAERT